MRKALVVLGVLSAAVCGVAQAHDEHQFEPLGEVARWRPPPTEQVAFLPLAGDFSKCLPLEAACPADSSSLVLVRAGGRPLGWMVAGEELPESTLATPPLRAIGNPPTDAGNQRYLVPVLDGEGQALEHLLRRFEGGRLVPVEPGQLADALHLAPVLVGPVLGGSAPSGEAPERVVEAPVMVAAVDLRDAVPALLVRRAPPSRVVFGVRMGSGGWLPLVDEHGVALLARHEGRVGLVVPQAPGESRTAVASAEEDDSDPDPVPVAETLGRVAFFVLLAATAIVLVRRRRRSVGAGDSVP